MDNFELGDVVGFDKNGKLIKHSMLHTPGSIGYIIGIDYDKYIVTVKELNGDILQIQICIHDIFEDLDYSQNIEMCKNIENVKIIFGPFDYKSKNTNIDIFEDIID